MEILTKRFANTKAEADASGNVVAVIATLNVEDRDRDVTLPGAFGRQAVKMIPAHDWESVWLGKGEIREEGDDVRADLKMNLEIPLAKDWHSALRFDLANGTPLAEWSYGFRILPGGSSMGEHQGHEVRFLRPTPSGAPGLEVFEVSPVLKGAGIGTRLEGVKSGRRFAEEIAEALEGVKGIASRARSILEIRERDGRGLSEERRAQILAVKSALEDAATLARDLGAMLEPAKPGVSPSRAFLEFAEIEARLRGALAEGVA